MPTPKRPVKTTDTDSSPTPRAQDLLEKIRTLPERQKMIVVTLASVAIVLLVVFLLSALSRLVL